MSEDKPTKSWNLFWPKIESPGDAEKAIKGAAGICAFVAVMGFLLSLAYKYGVLQIPAAKDSWYNVFTYGPLAYFIYEKSKTAVWLALGLYLVDRLLTLPHTNVGGLFISVIFTCTFISALRGLKYLEKNPPGKAGVESPESDRKAG
ncbi:hypothetical protein EZJ49_11555 [Bdellovibrio bacteriovorus]|uniref:hypothetical protein n=1 Tax=Bdellovibrio bacteriovorus TaxID=959 RepID=UPI0021D397A0|nr:hypothetical protein [Bdellovibrio bacteriovorus]UXR63706.1 hypothetical protein EZJ49_11555 [Bdellovibrio bacteriovorus]